MCMYMYMYVYIYMCICKYICILIYITHSPTHLCMSMYLPSHSLTSLTKICTCMFICILQCIYNCHYTPHSTNTLLYTYEVLPCTHRDALPFLQVKPAMLNMSTNEKTHLQPPLCTAYLAPRKVDGGCEPACLSCTTHST